MRGAWKQAGTDGMSQKFETLMMRVWREACRHIELSESTATISGLLRDDLPIGSLLVRQFDFWVRSSRR